MENLYLSICIPTNGRIEIVKNTLDSIFNNSNVPFSEFEVVLSDNSTNNELVLLLDEYKQYPNIVYEKTNSEGFLNSINALKMGKGLFLKLHNNYTMFAENSLHEIISLIKKEKIRKPLLFFKNSGQYEISSYNSFDSFCTNLSFWNSWSTGFAIWNEDFSAIVDQKVDKMFPHTSLLMMQHSKQKFAIVDKIYFVNQEVSKKGGYNLFRVFAVDYLNIMKLAESNKTISEITFEKIKQDLFSDFLVSWYCNTKICKNSYTFSLDKIGESLCVYYGKTGFYKLQLFSYLYFFKSKLLSGYNKMKIKVKKEK